MVALASLKFGLVFAALFVGVICVAFFAYVMILGRKKNLETKNLQHMRDSR